MMKFKFGTGKAKCPLCKKIIEKHEVDCDTYFYHQGQHYHYNCVKENAERLINERLKETL